jgi:uncharacterized protein (DUF1501 family)
MTLPRRLFLKNGGIAIAAVGAGALSWTPGLLGRLAFAADADRPAGKAGGRKVLVCIFQRGAADGLTMVVPHGDPFYYKHRTDIAVPRPSKGAADGSAAHDLDGFFGLHPQLKSLLPLYKAGHLAVVHACGSPSGSRSHFDMQDFMEAGVPDDKAIQTGWLNRMLVQRPEAGATPFRAVSMTSVVPRSLQGDLDALAIRDLSTFGIQGGGGNAGAASGFEGLYDNAVGDVLHGTGKESFEAISLLKKTDPTKYLPANGADYPANAFGKALTQVAQLIKADVGLEVAFLETDGWDTHANQGGAYGQLAGRLLDFGRTIAAFHRDLGDRMDDVLLLTMSEFGRAARQNGNRGTDHGHGNAMMIIGGGVRGGRVYGKWPGLAQERRYDGRDLAVTTDFRDVFGEIVVRHMGVSDPRTIFPGYTMQPSKFPGLFA